MAYAGSPSALFRHSSSAMSPLLKARSNVWKLFLIASGIAITASSSIDCLLPQAVAGFAQAAEVTPQRIDFIQQARMHGFGKPTFGLDRIRNAKRASERL